MEKSSEFSEPAINFYFEIHPDGKTKVMLKDDIMDGDMEGLEMK